LIKHLYPHLLNFHTQGSTHAVVVMTPERSKRVKSTRQLFPPSPVSGRRKASSTPKQTPTKVLYPPTSITSLFNCLFIGKIKQKQKTSKDQSRSTTPPKSSRVLRARKGAASPDALNGTLPPANSDGLPLKLREKFLKGKMSESPSAPPKKKRGASNSKVHNTIQHNTAQRNTTPINYKRKRTRNWMHQIRN